MRNANGKPKTERANHVRVTEEERALIEEKMKQIPFTAYNTAVGNFAKVLGRKYSHFLIRGKHKSAKCKFGLMCTKHNTEYKKQNVNIEICVPVSKLCKDIAPFTHLTPHADLLSRVLSPIYACRWSCVKPCRFNEHPGFK